MHKVPFKHQHSEFIYNTKDLSKKEEILYRNTLPSSSIRTQQFNPSRIDFIPNTGCVVQSTMHNCENLQPFVNFFQHTQVQEKLNDEWNNVNMDKRYRNLQKERDQESDQRNFNPVPVFDMTPVNTSCIKQNLIDSFRIPSN
tara:strand:- start:1845 stop:2270 length:426 start_codon:yes stop_codon:yes gene_type:complete